MKKQNSNKLNKKIGVESHRQSQLKELQNVEAYD